MLQEASLKELGVSSSRDQKYSLATEKVLVGKIPGRTQQDPTIVCCYLDHPFLGEHMYQLLNVTSPAKNNGREDTGTDMKRMSGLVHSGPLTDYSGRPNLQILHAYMGEIGPVFLDFVRYDLGSWIKAIDSAEGDKAFHLLDKLVIIDKEFAHQQLSESRRLLEKGEIEVWKMKNMVGAIYSSLGKKEFTNYLRESIKSINLLPEKKPDMRRRRYSKVAQWFNKAIEQEAMQAKVARVIEKYLQTLKPDDLANLTVKLLQHLAYDQPSYLHLEREKLYRPEYLKTEIPEVKINSSKVEISDSSNSVDLDLLYKASNGSYYWRVSEYHFSPEYRARGLYPIEAWRVIPEGKRELLTTAEFWQILGQYPQLPFHNPSLRLGHVLNRYFTPQRVGEDPHREDHPDWRNRITIMGRTQRMFGLQFGAVQTQLPLERSILLAESSMMPRVEAAVGV